MAKINSNVDTQDLMDLKHLSLEFPQRLIQMTGAFIQGYQLRLSRFYNQCSKHNNSFYSMFFAPVELTDVPALQARLISECSDFCIEEIRNNQQIIQLRFDEMCYWTDRLTQTTFNFLNHSDSQEKLVYYNKKTGGLN